MRTELRARLKRLESQSVERNHPSMLFRWGYLRSLPKDFVGERHVVIVRRERVPGENQEWCEFEERPGPGPPLENV